MGVLLLSKPNQRAESIRHCTFNVTMVVRIAVSAAATTVNWMGSRWSAIIACPS
jgi:hypothetical protein